MSKLDVNPATDSSPLLHSHVNSSLGRFITWSTKSVRQRQSKHVATPLWSAVCVPKESAEVWGAVFGLGDACFFF